MKQQILPKLIITTASLLITNTLYAENAEFYEAPMVSIPAGEFFMGSDRGFDNEKPVHKVSVPAFQMGKYEVTLAEFRKFVEDTNYQAADNCNHQIGERWFGSGERNGSWNNNMYATNEFYPVVCISRTDAKEYAKWLSQKTGKQYRLPTEAEWEYSSRAGTQTRFFYSDDKLNSVACEYANVADFHAKNLTEKLYKAPYSSSYTIQPCNDKEVLLSVVGIYKPNGFGIYDLIGNVQERLADCYQDSYNNAPNDGSAVLLENCERYVVRGGSWHWENFTSSYRGGITDNFVAALEGFRLALDTGGKQLPAVEGSREFVNKLKKAQHKAKVKHQQIFPYPDRPDGLKVINKNVQGVTLKWNENHDQSTKAYKVLRHHSLTNKIDVIAQNLKDTSFTDKNPMKGNSRYTVIAVNGESESLPSEEVEYNASSPITLPKKIQGEAFSSGQEVSVRNSRMEPDNDKIYSSIGDKEANYLIEVTEGGKFSVEARVFHTAEPQALELWLGDRKLAVKTLNGEQGWHTVTDISLELPKGVHTLRVKGNQSRFALNWLDFKSI